MTKKFLKPALMGILLGSTALVANCHVPSQGDMAEQWVNANLVRVHLNGKWEEFPLIPLADHLCARPDGLFKRHCQGHTGASEF